MTDTETVRRAPKKAPAKNIKNKKKKKKTPKQEMREWIITIAIALAIALLVRTFLFEPVVVDGNLVTSRRPEDLPFFMREFFYWYCYGLYRYR